MKSVNQNCSFDQDSYDKIENCSTSQFFVHSRFCPKNQIGILKNLANYLLIKQDFKQSISSDHDLHSQYPINVKIR